MKWTFELAALLKGAFFEAGENIFSQVFQNPYARENFFGIVGKS
jgi:hypothetical protein